MFVRRQIFPKGLKAFYGHYLTYPPQSPGRWREGRGSQQSRVAHHSEIHKAYFKRLSVNFPGGPMVKNLPANEGDTGSNPGPGRSHMLGGN